MKTLKIHILNRNLDQTEGRGPVVPAFYFASAELAAHAAKLPCFYREMGVQGGMDGSLVETKEIQLIESIEEFVRLRKDQVAQRALGKLSDLEKDALGVLR